MFDATVKTRYRLAALTLVAVVICLVLAHFHDRCWWAPDDGHHAHIAERLSNGEVLHDDIDDFHTDYAYLINALAIKLPGPDLLSLRWPLVILTVLQSCLVFLLFWRAPILTAAAAAMAFGTLTFIQFLNPQPHWYCLFLVVVVLVVLRTMAPGSLGRVAILGVLIGSIFLFRQLTGVFVAIAVTTCLLIERPRDQSAANPLLARIVIGSMFVGVLGFCLVGQQWRWFLAVRRLAPGHPGLGVHPHLGPQFDHVDHRLGAIAGRNGRVCPGCAISCGPRYGGCLDNDNILARD